MPHADLSWDYALWDDATNFYTQRSYSLGRLKELAARCFNRRRIFHWVKKKGLHAKVLKHLTPAEADERRQQYADQMARTGEALIAALDDAKTTERRLSLHRGGLPTRQQIKNLWRLLRFTLMLTPKGYPNPPTNSIKEWTNAAKASRDLWEMVGFLEMLWRCIGQASERGEVSALQMRVDARGATYVDLANLTRPHRSLKSPETQHLLASATFPKLLAQAVFAEVEDFAGRRDWPANELVTYRRVRHPSGFSVKSLMTWADNKPVPTDLARPVIEWINAKAVEFAGTNPDGPGDVLIGTTLGLKHMLTGEINGKMVSNRLIADNVAVISSKAAEGLNSYAGCKCEIVLSRSQATPGQLRTIAEAFKRGPIDMTIDEHWHYADVVEVAGSSPLRAPYHPDPYLNAVLQNECHASAIQMDRVRHVRKETPTEFWIMNELPTPQPVTEHVEWADLDCWFTIAAARHGVVPDLTTDKGVNQIAALLMPDLFKDPRAVLDVRRRRENLLAETPASLMATLDFKYPYRMWIKRKGARTRDIVVVDARNHREAVAKVKAALGDCLQEVPVRVWRKNGFGPLWEGEKDAD